MDRSKEVARWMKRVGKHKYVYVLKESGRLYTRRVAMQLPFSRIEGEWTVDKVEATYPDLVRQ